MKDTLMKVETTVLESRAATLARQRRLLDMVAEESSRLSSEVNMELGRVRRDLRIEHDAIIDELADRAALFGEEVSRVA